MNTKSNTNLYTTASIEISDSSGLNLTSKDLHLLRNRLNDVLEDVVLNVLDEFGIVQQNVRTIFIEEIEKDDGRDIDFVD